MGSEELGQLFYGLKNEENTNMTEKRVLNGYSKEVQADFKKLSEDYDFPLYEIMQNSFEHLPALKELIDVIQDEYDDKQLFQDIVDFINDKAKFPEQKYYVKLLDKEEGYLNCQKSFNDYFVNNNKDDDSDYQTQFTMTEIEAIDPRYKQFAIPVEEK